MSHKFEETRDLNCIVIVDQTVFNEKLFVIIKKLSSDETIGVEIAITSLSH